MYSLLTETLIAPRPRKHLGVFFFPRGDNQFAHNGLTSSVSTPLEMKTHVMKNGYFHQDVSTHKIDEFGWTEFEMDFSDWFNYEDRNDVCAGLKVEEDLKTDSYHTICQTRCNNESQNVNNDVTITSDSSLRKDHIENEYIDLVQKKCSEKPRSPRSKKNNDGRVERLNNLDNSDCQKNDILFPLQRELTVSPISRAQNPVPQNSSFLERKKSFSETSQHHTPILDSDPLVIRKKNNMSPFLFPLGFVGTKRHVNSI
ncbi:6932_t:CDS:2 [Acaulospora morrowiae]|uniref:6932_t:CDS:1 n=1 Tax=Acaulospora morrowiae TaxID=94023 RepID=A0A9N8Z735_9GLOM|nr:6932_t:CDS:2 [Acaulospora morrowiae]